MITKICFLNKHNTKNNQFRPHSHNCYEVVYIVVGNGKIIIDNKNYEVSTHSYCIIPPHTEHTEVLDGYGEILFVGFEYDDASYRLEKGIYSCDNIGVDSYINAIFEEYRKQSIQFKAAADNWLRLLLIALQRGRSAEDEKHRDLDFIKMYIEQYSDQKINFRELALLSGYSNDYFRHLFKQRFGVAPQEYMINIRLEKARRLLKKTNLSCTEIAYNCGFSNSAQMTAMFKKKYGKTPKEFKITD